MNIRYGEFNEEPEIDNRQEIAAVTSLSLDEVSRILNPDNTLWYDDALVRDLIENRDARLIALANEEVEDRLENGHGDEEMIAFLEKQKQDLEKSTLPDNDLWLLVCDRLIAIHYELMD